MKQIKSLKIAIKLTIRFMKDLLQGYTFTFASKRVNEIIFNESISVTQEIKPSEYYENKVFNITHAANKINGYCIMPNEIFSFWKIIGNPNHEFKNGRTLFNGQIKEEVGGGICQVSGIVYNIALIANLQILERYNHSVDIYTEETRFAPLGLDATVVYGYKDLRFRNHYDFPIKLVFEITENKIRVDLLSTKFLKPSDLFFETKIEDNSVCVTVLNEDKRVLNTSTYHKHLVQ